MSCTVLLTCAGGGIDSAMLGQLSLSARHSVVVAAPDVRHAEVSNTTWQQSGKLGAVSECARLLTGIDVVTHCAGRPCVMGETEESALTDYRQFNVYEALSLASQAAAAGVKRFVFISSIKVDGDSTDAHSLYRSGDPPRPVEAFGISKMEAEQGLRALAAEAGLEVVIIRAFLVYEPGVKANFLTLVRLDNCSPLPFFVISNRRSLISLENPTSLIMLVIDHPRAANETFLVSDGEDLSTHQLLQRIAEVLGRTAYLFPVLESVLRGLANVLEKRSVGHRLWGSLQVDTETTRTLLWWALVASVGCGFRAVARYYQEEHRK